MGMRDLRGVGFRHIVCRVSALVLTVVAAVSSVQAETSIKTHLKVVSDATYVYFGGGALTTTAGPDAPVVFVDLDDGDLLDGSTIRLTNTDGRELSHYADTWTLLKSDATLELIAPGDPFVIAEYAGGWHFMVKRNGGFFETTQDWWEASDFVMEPAPVDAKCKVEAPCLLSNALGGPTISCNVGNLQAARAECTSYSAQRKVVCWGPLGVGGASMVGERYCSLLTLTDFVVHRLRPPMEEAMSRL